LAFVEFDWHDSVGVGQRDFSINSYGVGNTMISDVTPEVDKIEYLKNALIAKLTENRQGINRMDFQDKGAKEIKRYFQYNFPEGYVYCIILNNDNEATFKETLIFDTFDHIKL
jgi:hypothetical protein